MSVENSVSEREREVNRILADYLESQRQGNAPNRQDLLRRHPDLADELRSFFGDLDHFGRLAGPVAPPAAERATTRLLGEAPGADPGLGTVRYFGDYELAEEIARGGMGVVYKARQVSLNRTVALKMILAGRLASREDVRRFHREAEAAANLDHPHIVPIYEVGEHLGQNYFSMKLVEGGSLAGRTKSLSGREAAALVATVSRAVHHAHQRGVLHRDLKPGNILLDAQGQPYVTDFGLARRVEGRDRQTRTGSIVGTASYMPPEQARAHKVLTTRVDVYSLGAILYDLLTGHPPFRAETPLETIRLLLERDPEPPRKVDPRVDRDLETICLKCLEKDPERRFDSAAAVADDLERWLNGEPIVARPATSLERLVKWSRRRPAVAALVGVSLTAAVALLILGLFYDARLRVALGQVDQVRGDADADRAAARKANEGAQERLRRAEGLLFTAESGVALPDKPTLALRLAIEGARRLPGLQANHALQAALETCWEERALQGHGDEVLAVAYSPDGRRLLTASRDRTAGLWDTATGRVQAVVKGHEAAVTFATFSPDGRRALTLALGPDRSAIIWDADTGRKLVRLKLSSDWDARFQAPGPGDPPGLEFLAEYRMASFSPDGRRVVTAFGEYPDFTARVWDAISGEELRILKGHAGSVGSASFSPDGRWILTGSLDRTARIWDAQTGREVHVLRGHAGAVSSASFSPDGRRVLTVGEGRIYAHTPAAGYHTEGVNVYAWQDRPGTLDGCAGIVWDAATGKEVARLTWPSSINGITRRAAFSPDSRRVVTAGCRNFNWTSGRTQEELRLLKPCGVPRVWDAATGEILRVLDGPDVRTFAFSPDGKRLITAGAAAGDTSDNWVSVWDLETGKALATLRGHDGPVLATTFSPDGRHIVTTSADRTARIWEAPDGRSPGRDRPTVSRAALSPDGRVLVGVSGDQVVLEDVATGKAIRPLRKAERVTVDNAGSVVDVAASLEFSPDGRRVLILSSCRELAWIHDVETGKELAALRSRTPKGFFAFQYAAYSPDGREVVAICIGNEGHIFDAGTGKELLTLTEGSEARSASFSPDGSRILTSPRLHRRAGFVTLVGAPPKSTAPDIWDAASGKILVTLMPSQPRPGVECSDAEFSPDGRRVVGVYSDNTIRIWDAGSGRESVIIRGHSGRVDGAVFSPDGRRVLTASQDRSARIWDASTGEEIVCLKGHESGVGAGVQEMSLAVYSPDGRRVVTGEVHGTARLWDAYTGQQLAVWKGPRDSVFSADFSRDGRRVLIGHLNGEAECWLRRIDPLEAALERKPPELTAEEQRRYQVAGSVD